ncbi:hypothetical protein KR038_007733, partial [Drosophila bunnanda]
MSSSKRSVKKCSGADVGDDGATSPRDSQQADEAIPKPRDAMRWANCQDYRFHQAETYPSIRPPVSTCNTSRTLSLLADSLEADGCGRPFDEIQDDVMFLWQKSPDKHTLGFYGIGAHTNKPEAVMFNQRLMASLAKASGRRSARPARSPPPPPRNTPGMDYVSGETCIPYILNRGALQSELQQMPIVQRRLDPRTAFESIFCTDPVDPDDPFGVAQHEESMVSRDKALGMERPPKKTPHGLRRRHWYCPPVKGSGAGGQDACSQFECAEYRLDPQPKEFRLREQKELSPEPKDYDQLFERFLKCFEQDPSPDPLCKMYETCCGTKKSHGDDGQGGGDGQDGGGGGS